MKRRFGLVLALTFSTLLALLMSSGPATGLPGSATTHGAVPAILQPADKSPNVKPAPVDPDITYTTASGHRVEMYTSVGNLEGDADWRQVNQFAYMVSTVPKGQQIYSSIYNTYWDGRSAALDPATNKWIILDSAGMPESTVFGVTQAFRDQLNQYSSAAEAQQYIHTIGNRVTIGEALKNGSSLADLLNKSGVLKTCPYGDGACLSRVAGALFHDKFALFSKAKDATGKLWDNVVWITSANLNGASGGKKTNTSVAIYGDSVGYNNILNNLWNPSMNMTITSGFTAGAKNGFASSSSDFLYIPSPRTVDFEGNYLKASYNVALGGTKSGCKVSVSHSLFSMARKAVADALVQLQKEGCSVKVIVGPASIADITDTYFQMGESLRKLIANFQYANVHDKTVSISYTLSGTKRGTLFVGSANLNGTSMSGDELHLRITNLTATQASEKHTDWIYTLAKLGTNIIPVVSVAVTPGDANVSVGESVRLTATVLPTNATRKDFVWKSTDPSIATVDSSGLVTGVKLGTTSVTATSVSGGVVGTATITVGPPPAKINDFDGDGKVDAAYVATGSSDTPGSIRVDYGSGSSKTITPSSLGFTDAATNRYLTAATKDFNQDTFADLAVGVPAQNSSGDTGAGKVYILWGSANGLGTDNITELTSPGVYADGADGVAKGSFGTAVAAISGPSPMLLVGEPNAKFSDGTSGGAVWAYSVHSDGIDSEPLRIEQDSLGLPGGDEAGDQFGAALAGSGNILLVGIPGEDIGSVKDGGSVAVFRFSSPTSYKASGYSQDSSGVPGGVESGDRFGEVLAVTGGQAVIGIPSEDIGSKKDAGSIQPFSFNATSVSWQSARSQDSSGVPGGTESGDRFGAVTQVVRQCAGKSSILVGVPGEDIGTTVDQGVVDLIPLSPTTSCPIREYISGSKVLTDVAAANIATPVDLSVVRTPGTSVDALLITSQKADASRTVMRLDSPFTAVASSKSVPAGTWVVDPMA